MLLPPGIRGLGPQRYPLPHRSLPPFLPFRHKMYGNDVDGDFVFTRAWQIITEISDQLAHNQKFTSSLLSQADILKVTLSP
jgi:hypothetical protein